MHRDYPVTKMALLTVLAASFIVGVFPGRACQYCRMAATDPEAAKVAAQMHAGGFPLDATLNQFQPSVSSATLITPPASGSVATSVSDLLANPRVVKKEAAVLSSAAPTTADHRAPGHSATTPSPAPNRWADAGLLGLLGMGGWFCWRTRRVSAPVD